MSHQNFVKELSRLDSSKTVTEKFRDLCELAYCAYAKPTATRERAETLESRYMQIVSSYPDKDILSIQEAMTVFSSRHARKLEFHIIVPWIYIII